MSHYTVPTGPKLSRNDPPPLLETEDTAQTPADIHTWLMSRGWIENYQAMADGTKLWQHNDDQQNLFYTWSEAVAYEFYRFCNLGKD